MRCAVTDAATAARERDAGIAAALEHAEAERPQWSDVAIMFLTRYARNHATFISEDVTAAAAEFGLRTVQPKAWGAVFLTAARGGIIVKAGYGISNRRHRSPTPRWQSQIYGGKA
jgi:hypothetical protein